MSFWSWETSKRRGRGLSADSHQFFRGLTKTLEDVTEEEVEEVVEEGGGGGGKASRLYSVWSCASCQPVHDR